VGEVGGCKESLLAWGGVRLAGGTYTCPPAAGPPPPDAIATTVQCIGTSRRKNWVPSIPGLPLILSGNPSPESLWARLPTGYPLTLPPPPWGGGGGRRPGGVGACREKSTGILCGEGSPPPSPRGDSHHGPVHQDWWGRTGSGLSWHPVPDPPAAPCPGQPYPPRRQKAAGQTTPHKRCWRSCRGPYPRS
jgi:hypothetical protein